MTFERHREGAKRRLIAGEEGHGAVERAPGVRRPALHGQDVPLQRGELRLVGELDGGLDLALGPRELLADHRILVLLRGLGRPGEHQERPVVAREGGGQAPDRFGLPQPALGEPPVAHDAHVGRGQRLDEGLELRDALLVARVGRQDLGHRGRIAPGLAEVREVRVDRAVQGLVCPDRLARG